MALPRSRDLTDAQWTRLDFLIPEQPRRRDRKGCPWKDRRTVLNGILWVLRTGAPGCDLPERYPSYQTCHRRFQQWVRSGIMRGRLDVREALSMAALLRRKKGIKGRQDETWQGNEDHGGGRPPWPSRCRMR